MTVNFSYQLEENNKINFLDNNPEKKTKWNEKPISTNRVSKLLVNGI